MVATETTHGRVYTIFCECKNWKRRVPQTVTHAFRTVVAEAGAHIGYLDLIRRFPTRRDRHGTIHESEARHVCTVYVRPWKRS